MLETTLPFKGYNSFVINLISRLTKALQEGLTPLFLTVGGVNPDENGNGPVRMNVLEEEDLERYKENTKEYSAIITNFIADTKGNLEGYKYKFVCYITDVHEIDLEELPEELAEEAKNGAQVEVEFPTGIESLPKMNGKKYIQIYIRDGMSLENIWKTTIPSTIESTNENTIARFHFEDIRTDLIDIVKSDVLDTLRNGTL
jgi:hypothetical protein